MIIRQAIFQDAYGIAKVHVETWQHAYRGQISDQFLDSLSIENRKSYWEHILKIQDNNTKTFVALFNGVITGFATAGICRDEDMPSATGELLAIYVTPDVMSKGVGSALHDASLAYLRALGMQKATLWVLSTNHKTRKWYEGKQWRVEGRTKVDRIREVELNESRYIIEL